MKNFLNFNPFMDAETGGTGGTSGETAQPQAGEGQQQTASNDSISTPTEGQTEAQKQEIMLKYKYNHQEIEEPFNPDVHGELIQKGKNYDKVYENYNKLQSDPRLSFVENLAKQYDMTPEQYIQAVNQEQEQNRLNELIQSNIPPELASEILENRKFRETMTERERDFAKQEADKKMYADFVTEFPDIKADTIPKEVWEAVNAGDTLVNSYMRYEHKQLKTQLAAKNSNTANAENSPGSMTGNGAVNQGMFTKAQVEAMTREEVRANLDNIIKSQKTW